MLGLSRVRVAYTAGEAIGPDLFSFYRSLGLNLKQLYGQTEAFLYLTAQPDGQIHADTVGPAVPNVDLRIAESGEVLFRSPGMFIGYFKDEARTAEVRTADGYVRTGDAGFFDAKTGHLKIIDRAKDVGRLTGGTLFPPKYIENKLKFFPNIREAVAFGDGRDFVAAMINIDLTAVGSWAERNNLVYGSYQELAGHPLVYEMLQKNVEEVNRALAEEKVMAGAQIRRFLILHKELDADDGELTRTQKVRRGFIAERYAPLIKALYDGSREADIATEVTFEDGRKGAIAARVKIRDVETTCRRAGHGEGGMRAPATDIAAGEVLLSVENVSLSFGGVKAIRDVSFDIRKGEIRAIIGPNGAGKTSMLNVINGFYQPQAGRITFKGKTRAKMRPTMPRTAGSRAPSRTSRCSRHERARQHHGRAHAQDAPRISSGSCCASARRSPRRWSIAGGSRRSSISSKSRRSARCRSARLPYGLQKRVELGRALAMEPDCCCSTSRWPA